MAEQINFNNPAFRGVQAQSGTMYKPSDTEVFAFGGSNDSINNTGEVYYQKDGTVKRVNLANLAYQTNPTAKYSSSGAAWEAGRNILSAQGINMGNIKLYNPADVTAFGGSQFKNIQEGSLDELKSIYGATPQTGGNIGAQTNIQGVGPGAATMDQAIAQGTATNYDSALGADKIAQLQAQDKATQAQAGSAPVYTQPTQTGQVQNPTYNPALVPTTPQTPLQKTINTQVQSNPQALANNAFINGVFKAYHGRDANAQELARYSSRTVGDSYKEIIGGAPTQQGTQDANLIAQGFDLIDNPAELEKLSAMAGFDPSKIVKVDARMYAPPKLNVGSNGVFGSSDVTDPVSSDLLKGAGKSDLNSDFLASTVNNYADQYNSQIPNSFTEIRNLFYKEVLNNKYRQELYAGLLEKSQIDELSAQLTSIDKQIASRKQAWDTLSADVANTPISITAIQGRNAHIANMKNIEIEGLLGQRNAIAGDYDRAQKQLDNAYKIAEADYSQKVEGMKLFYEDAKELFNKQEQRTYEAKIKAEEQKFELYKEDLKTKKDLMMKYPTAGITLNDSFDIAVNKVIPSYLQSLENSIKNEFQLVETKTGNFIFNKNTGEYQPMDGSTGNDAYSEIQNNVLNLGLKTSTIGNRQVTGNSLFLDLLGKANEDMIKAGAGSLQINQDFRTGEQQAKLYAQLSKTGGRVAEPGTSFHEKGLAIDVTNWEKAAPFLAKYGIVNGLPDDMGHFSMGEMNPDVWNTIIKQNPSLGAKLTPEAQTLKSKYDLISSLENHRGLSKAVGAFNLARWTPFKIDTFSGDTSDFTAGVKQLTSKDTLDTLINLKQAGGTLGALSDGEREMLVNAASKIGTWERKREDGSIYYSTSEAYFKKELEKIKELTSLALERSGFGYLADQKNTFKSADDILKAYNTYNN